MKNFNLKASRKLCLFALPGLLLSLSACSSLQVGRDFDINSFIQSVKPGVTSKMEIENRLGQPMSSGISVDKNGVASEEWMYFYGTGNLPKMDKTKIKILQIRYDQNGKIRTYNWSKSKE